MDVTSLNLLQAAIAVILKYLTMSDNLGQGESQLELLLFFLLVINVTQWLISHHQPS